jgi:hypothetical protein
MRISRISSLCIPEAFMNQRITRDPMKPPCYWVVTETSKWEQSHDLTVSDEATLLLGGY